MTYNLKEFKTWLAANPTKQNNLPHWEDYLRIISYSELTLTILPTVFKPKTVVKTSDGELLSPEYKNVLLEWKALKDKEDNNRLAKSQEKILYLKDHNKKLVSKLEALQAEIDELNIALLQQQGISSKSSKSKQEIRSEFTDDIKHLESENECLLEQNEQLKAQSLLNQDQSTNWLDEHKGSLLLIGGISLTAYLLIKQ